MPLDVAPPLLVKPTVVARRVERGSLLLDNASGLCFELNSVGAEIWSQLEKGARQDEIIDGLAAHYGISRDQAAKDTQALLDQLLAHGILRAAR